MTNTFPDGWNVQTVPDGFEAKKWFSDHYKTCRGRTEEALAFVIGETELFHTLNSTPAPPSEALAEPVAEPAPAEKASVEAPVAPADAPVGEVTI